MRTSLIDRLSSTAKELHKPHGGMAGQGQLTSAEGKVSHSPPDKTFNRASSSGTSTVAAAQRISTFTSKYARTSRLRIPVMAFHGMSRWAARVSSETLVAASPMISTAAPARTEAYGPSRDLRAAGQQQIARHVRPLRPCVEYESDLQRAYCGAAVRTTSSLK